MMSQSKEYLKDKFLHKLNQNEGLVYLTASNVGIDTKTYYNWCKKDSVFKDHCRLIRKVKLDENRMRMINLAKAGHFGAIERLETILKDELFVKKETKTQTNEAVIDLDTRIAVYKRNLAEAEMEKLKLEHAR